MAENRAEFVIALDGDDSAIRGIFSAFKRTVSDAATELERTTGNIVLFRGLKENLDRARASVVDATDGLAKLREQVKATEDAGGEVGKELAKNIRDAERAVAAANREFNKTQAAVDRMAKSLTAAGVNTKALATEEIRLATAAKQAAAAEAERQAAQVLGIKLSRDVTAEIQKQVAAFNALRASGAVSTQDIANAQKALAANVKQATATLQTGRAAASGFGESLTSGIARALLPFASITAAVGAVVTAIKAAITATRELEQAIADIGSITNLTRDQLTSLRDDVRALALSLGIDLNSALKATFDLIRSGVPEDSVVEVLRVSALAAKAAFVDVSVGAKAASVLLDAFGATASELPELFDKITKGAHDGGATLKEFADSAGPLLNVARAAGVSFDDLLAVLTVVVDRSGNAEKSFADLTKIIQKLDTTEVRVKLAALGITGGTLAETLHQIGERQLTLNDVLELGVGSAGKQAAALATLTNNAKAVPEEFERIASALGEVKRANDALIDTPRERSARFNATLHETALAFGEIFGDGSKLQALGTELLSSFNSIVLGVGPLERASRSLDVTFGGLVEGFSALPIPAGAAAEAMRASGAAAAESARQMEFAATEAGKVRDALGGLNAALLADVKALQDATTRDIADAAARAEAQIAQLNRARSAEAATAKATLDIRLDLARQQLEIIQKSEKAITAAIDVAVRAREAKARAAGENQRKIEADTAAARLQGVGQTLAAYEKLYADLVNLAQNAHARIQGFEEARVSIAQKVEDEIRAIRLGALDGLDQYVARNAEIDRLVSEGRRKAAEGDTAAAKQFFEQAIAESKNLAEVVNRNGVKVITATQAQTDRVAALKKIQDAANEAFGEQAEAARRGAEATIEETGKVAGRIAELQAQYDALRATVADGLQFKIETDEASVAQAFATLDELTRPRTVTVTVRTVNEQGAPVAAPAGFADGGPVGFAGGGPVEPSLRRAVRAPATRHRAAIDAAALAAGPLRRRAFTRGGKASILAFARGGPVFRTPAWLRVPGSGTGDTVPAALRVGSYVVRRSASRYYGDGLMSRLARGAAPQRLSVGGRARAIPLFADGTLALRRLPGGAAPAPAARQRGTNLAGEARQRARDPRALLVRLFAGGGTVTREEIRRYALETFGFDPFATPAAGGGFGMNDRGLGTGANAGAPEPIAGSAPTGGGGASAPRRPGDSVQPKEPPVSFDPRPIPDELITATNVITYAQEMLNMVGQTNPLLGVLLPAILDGIRAVQARPGDQTALVELLKAAETIGANPFVFAMWGKTTASIGRLVPTWFIDWARDRGLVDGAGDITSQSSTGVDASGTAARLIGRGLGVAGVPPLAARILGGPASERIKRFFGAFASGGGATSSGSDTVPALLTPGEWIIRRPVVRHYGEGFLRAVNAMAIPRPVLASMMAPPMPVSRFAEGGPVGGASRIASSPGGSATNPSALTVNINAAAGDILSEANVRRFVLPVMRDVIRKSS